jgi:Fic family protein
MIRLEYRNDTIMVNLNKKQQHIIGILFREDALSSSVIQEKLAGVEENISLVTVKRALSEMVELGVLSVSGSGRSTVYSVHNVGRMFADVDAKEYCSIEPDVRYGLRQFNFDLFADIPEDVFSKENKDMLDAATNTYRESIKALPDSIQKKELQRLIIELSWKSSKIEGNTYTLLDTEKLLLENKVAQDKTKEETQMILNHKEAFDFIHAHTDRFETLTRRNMEEVHSILVKDLGVDSGLREKRVGVVGSIYRPLDNIHQITEAVGQLEAAIFHTPSAYGKAFLALIGIAYIQPFNDGNKRTSRLMANALLLSHGLSPLSYRSVDENSYREAMLVFYEVNSLIPIKNIFVEQYDFAARNYAVV